jgi:signal transduction histidine kinase
VLLDLDGPVDTLPPGVDLAAYRVVQEALTNVLRHSCATRAEVRIRAGDALVIEVCDDGEGAQGFRLGHGLTGMRERVLMYGGAFHAGPRPDGGFAVVAEIPLADEECGRRAPGERAAR